jgi:hypothetical protein
MDASIGDDVCARPWIRSTLLRSCPSGGIQSRLTCAWHGLIGPCSRPRMPRSAEVSAMPPVAIAPGMARKHAAVPNRQTDMVGLPPNRCTIGPAGIWVRRYLRSDSAGIFSERAAALPSEAVWLLRAAGENGRLRAQV